MAKSKEAPAFNGTKLDEAPKKLPDGLRVYQSKGTVSEGSGDDRVSKSGVLSYVGPELSNAGVIAYQKWLASHGVDEASLNEYVAKCLLNAVSSGVRSMLTPDTIGEGERCIPAAPNTRTVDAATAAGDALADFIREHGRGPNADELAEIYGGLVPSA